MGIGTLRRYHKPEEEKNTQPEKPEEEKNTQPEKPEKEIKTTKGKK